ncbi:MAG: DUF2185 domain-containing protein [Anaerofustis sp.]
MKSAGLGGCIISRNIIDAKGELRWCVKDEAVNELDNGWRFFADIDTEDFLNNPDNMVVCDWNTIVEIEPAVMAVFDLPTGTDLTFVVKDGRKFFISTSTGKEISL